MTEEKKRKAKWQNDYINKAYDRINLTVPKGDKDKIKAHAESRGESVNAFINRAIAESIANDNDESLYPQIMNVAEMYPEKWEAVKNIIDRNRAERSESPHPTPNQIQKIKELKEQRKKQGE